MTTMMMIRTTGLASLGFATGIAVTSCATESRVLYADHCANQTGDEWCGTRYDDGSRPFCILGNGLCGTTTNRDGCVEERPVADECYSPCGASMSFEDDATCLPGGESTGDSTSTGETTTQGSESGSESSTTGPMPCVGDEECTDADAPFCGTTGECGTCDATDDPNGACAGVDAMAPLCVDEACVACTAEDPIVCDEQLLLCDDASNSCVPCDAHDQCGSGACQLAVGTCFPPDGVVHVDGDGGQDFMTVVAAVNNVAASGVGVIIVHELDGGGSYQGATLIDGGKTIALLAAPGESPILQGTGGNPGLRVEGAGTIVYMDGLGVVGNTMGLGLRVDGALAWVDRSRIVQNSSGGIVAQNGAELTLRNCFVGDGTNGANALTIDGAASMVAAEVNYTTLGAGFDNFADAFPIMCNGTVDVVVRNSLLVSLDNAMGEISCSVGTTVSNTASEALIPGTGNVALGDVGVSWFSNIDAGDFHLQAPPAMVGTVARWQTGDPSTDLDGQPRPTVNDTPDYAGADVP